PMGLGYDVTSPDLSLFVFVFFTLSGFLVFRPFARGPVSTRDHLTRLLLRIFPAYLVALAVTFLFAGFPPIGEGLRDTLMIQLPETGQPLGVLAVAWTLHVEVLFYLALPALAMLLARARGHDVAVLVAIATLSVGAFILTDPMRGTFVGRPLIAPLMAWAFLPGMVVAWALERSPSAATALARPPTLLAGALLLGGAFLLPRSVIPLAMS